MSRCDDCMDTIYSCIRLFLLYVQSMSSTHLYIYLSILELSPNASNGVIASVNNSKTTPHVSKTDRCRPSTTYLPIHQPYSIDIIIIIIILMTIIILPIHQPYSIITIHHNYLHHDHHRDHLSSSLWLSFITIITTIPYSRYYLRRLKHPAGEVTCLSIDEYVSLPPDSSLSVKYHSAVVAQGFMSIKKMWWMELYR